MSTLTIKTQVTHKEEREVEIPIPSFWKNEDGDEFKALLDDKTFMQINFYRSIDTVMIQNGDAENYKRTIASTHTNFLVISEEEFMSAYKDARFKTDLEPMLISKQMA